MPRPKTYDTEASKYKAYRARKAAKANDCQERAEMLSRVIAVAVERGLIPTLTADDVHAGEKLVEFLQAVEPADLEAPYRRF